MKAVIMSRTGPADLLDYRDVPEPAITRPTQIKVRLRAAGVNPVDTKIRRNGVFYPDGLPAILGCDGAGEVVEVGAEARRFRPGNRVWFCNGGLGGDPGNYAQYTVLEERWAAPMPRTLDFETAAAGPLALITAWGMLYDRGRLEAGKTVLIHAGAGGVGHLGLQLAKLRGARVLTTVGSAAHAELARQCGADAVIDHRQQDFVEAVNGLTGGRGADLVVEMVGPEVFARSILCTADFGDLVTLLDPGPLSLAEARKRNLRIGFELMLTPLLKDLEEARRHHRDILQQCADLIDGGQLTIHLGKTYPLADAAAAHAEIEAGHATGKIVLTM
jgi:NADPH2:quinone reductase